MRVSFDRWLDELTDGSRVSRELAGDVLGRVAHARAPIARVDLATGVGLAPRLVPLSEGSVSRAVKNLLDLNLLEEEDPVVERPGRPLKKLKLTGQHWRSIGVHVHTRHGHATALTGVMTSLDGAALMSCCSNINAAHGLDDPDEFVEAVGELVTRLKNTTDAQDGQARILGVGIDLGGHVNAGTVIDSTPTGWLSIEFANRLEAALDLPVVIENDVNALAIYETYRRPVTESVVAYVTVLDEGVGGALVINGRLYRGGFGMAGEIGHIPVEYRPDPLMAQVSEAALNPTTKAKSRKRSFTEPCPAPCGGLGHVDCLAPPVRVRAELRQHGHRDYAATLRSTSVAGQSAATPPEKIVERGGRALGRGLACLINLVNPTRLILYLPTEFALAEPDTVGARYADAVEAAVSTAFSTGAHNARAGSNRLKALAISDAAGPLDSTSDQGIDQVDYYLAKSSAWCVLNAFLEHAAGHDRPAAPEPRF
jgi:hypothetical protein